MGLINDNRWAQFADAGKFIAASVYADHWCDGVAAIARENSTNNVSGAAGNFTTFSRTYKSGGDSAQASKHDLLFHFSVPTSNYSNINLRIFQRWNPTGMYCTLVGNGAVDIGNVNIRLIVDDFTWSTVTWATRPNVTNHDSVSYQPNSACLSRTNISVSSISIPGNNIAQRNSNENVDYTVYGFQLDADPGIARYTEYDPFIHQVISQNNTGSDMVIKGPSFFIYRAF